MFHEIQFFEETVRVNFVPGDEFVALKWNVSIVACQFHQILRLGFNFGTAASHVSG